MVEDAVPWATRLYAGGNGSIRVSLPLGGHPSRLRLLRDDAHHARGASKSNRDYHLVARGGIRPSRACGIQAPSRPRGPRSLRVGVCRNGRHPRWHPVELGHGACDKTCSRRQQGDGGRRRQFGWVIKQTQSFPVSVPRARTAFAVMSPHFIHSACPRLTTSLLCTRRRMSRLFVQLMRRKARRLDETQGPSPPCPRNAVISPASRALLVAPKRRRPLRPRGPALNVHLIECAQPLDGGLLYPNVPLPPLSPPSPVSPPSSCLLACSVWMQTATGEEVAAVLETVVDSPRTRNRKRKSEVPVPHQNRPNELRDRAHFCR